MVLEHQASLHASSHVRTTVIVIKLKSFCEKCDFATANIGGWALRKQHPRVALTCGVVTACLLRVILHGAANIDRCFVMQKLVGRTSLRAPAALHLYLIRVVTVVL